MLDCLADRPSLCLGSGMPRHLGNWQQSILFCSWKKAQDRTNTQVFPLNQRPVPLFLGNSQEFSPNFLLIFSDS